MDKRRKALTLRRSFSDGSAPLLRSPSGCRALSHLPTFSNRCEPDCEGSSPADHGPQISPLDAEPEGESETCGALCLSTGLARMDISQQGAKKHCRSKFRMIFEKGREDRKKTLDRGAKLASSYALDALAGRLEHGLGAASMMPWYITWSFALQTSSVWFWCVFTCSLAHSVMALYEPRPGIFHATGILRWIEVACMAVYVADVILKAAYMGLRSYLRKPWHKIMIGVVFMLIIDASGVFPRRFALPLRPVVLSLRTRFIRRFYTVVGDMLPGVSRACIPVIFFLFLASSLATAWFGRAKSDFENFTAACVSIWTLMVSGDNYGSLVNEPLKHLTYVPFMAVVIVVGPMFLLALLLGVAFDVFTEHTAEQAKSERIKQLKALNLAFAALDHEDTGKISFSTWDQFLQHMLPRCTRQERMLYFKIASGFREELDVIDFLDLKRVLSYSFVNPGVTQREGSRSVWWRKQTCLVSLLRTMKSILDLKQWKLTVAAVVMLDFFALPFGIPHQGPGERVLVFTTLRGVVLLVDQAFQLAHWMLREPVPRLRWVGRDRSLHAKVVGYAVVAHTAVVVLMFCPRVMSALCSGVSLAADAWWPPVLSFSPVDGSCAPSETPAGGGIGLEREQQLYGDGAGEIGHGSGTRGLCVTSEWCMEWLPVLAYTLRILRCWRLVTLNDTLQSHVDTFFSVVPKFTQTLSFALVAIYAFAMIGMQILWDRASAFRDVRTSLNTTLQVFMMVDLSSTMERTMTEAGHWTFLFFVICHAFGVLIVFNLLTAIMIQVYGEMLNENSRVSVEARRKADEKLQELLQECVQQEVIKLWQSCPQGIRYDTGEHATREVKKDSGSEIERKARRVLGWRTKEPAISQEELLKCQSYARVDLCKALLEKARESGVGEFDGSLHQNEENAEGAHYHE